MKTLNLQEAALFLKMTPEGLRRKVSNGQIPGAKPGKRWVFTEDDLAEFLRSLYANGAKETQGVQDRRNLWHSTKGKTYGGLILTTMEKDYKKALGLSTK
jgi:excisionase family DNA binding protein